MSRRAFEKGARLEAGDMDARKKGTVQMRKFVLLGALNLFVAVALGAFGAHGLKGKIDEQMLANWQTGVHYQMVHALGLLFLAMYQDRLGQLKNMYLVERKRLNLAGNLLFAGIVIFSGSLFVMALTGLRVLGAITPIGGVCFLTGWLLVAWSAWSAQKK
jgi:uncharacterized membrane protein YgdD (TMEM256/DUF423 family)